MNEETSSEDIAAMVMMPLVIRESFRNPDGVEDMEACLNTCASYSAEIDRFALSNENRGPEFYASFREVIIRYCSVFHTEYPIVKDITDAQIDTVLEKVKEARDERNTIAMPCLGSVETKD